MLRTSDNTLTRGGPLMERPRGWTANVNLGNRSTSQTRWSGGFAAGGNEDGGLTRRASGSFSFRPGPRWRLSMDPFYERLVEPQQYVATVGGGRPQTFWGLSGLGDLLTTCMSPASRNRSLGEALGRGRSLRQVLGTTEMVVEGVETVRVALALGRKHRVELPIMREVERVLFHSKSPRQAVQDLMTRAFKAE